MWYIFRHGETFYNVSSKFVIGHMKNVFLTFNGALQAHMNGIKLKKTNEDFSKYRFIVSPLERAIHTCQIILDEINLPFNCLEIDELIEERSKGIFDGMLKTDINKKYSEEMKLIEKNPWSYSFSDGYESYKINCLKLAKFIEKYKEEENLVIVAHQGIDQFLMFLLQQQLKVDNLVDWINNLDNDTANNIVKNIKSVDFNQNYFYSWDGKELIKI